MREAVLRVLPDELAADRNATVGMDGCLKIEDGRRSRESQEEPQQPSHARGEQPLGAVAPGGAIKD